MIGGGSVLLISFLGVGLLWAHPMFQIRNVRIAGIQYTDRDAFSKTIRTYLEEPVFLFFKRQNRFLFNQETLRTRLHESFAFRDLQIQQQGTHVRIQAVERTSQLLWKTGERWFLVDLEGVVIREIAQDEREHLVSILPLFVDRNDVQIGVGDHVLTSEETEAVFRFHEHLKTQGIEFVQTEFDRLSGKWVGILTSINYRILFDPSADVDIQAGRLDVLLREKIPDPKLLQYIDLRFGDHVYFK